MTRMKYLEVPAVVTTKVGLRAIESASRSLGYIVLPRLVFAATDKDYTKFAGVLVALARKAQDERKATAIVSLVRTRKSPIQAICMQCWSGNSQSHFNEQILLGPVELSESMTSISPFAGRDLAPASLPVCGVIRDRFIAGLEHKLPISEDGSMVYLAASARGFWELGRVLGAFAQLDDTDAVQFEHSPVNPGVGAASYELEFVKNSSFAAESLFDC
jgi:hypothetical protein